MSGHTPGHLGATHVWKVGSAVFHAKRNSDYEWYVWKDLAWVFVGQIDDGDISTNEHGNAREVFGRQLYRELNPEYKWHKCPEASQERYRAAYDSGYRKIESSAALDLLEALQDMVDMMDSGGEPGKGSDWHKKASKAIARAKGKA